MDKILVTGCSGFIGMHLCRKLLDNVYNDYGVDNMNDYNDVYHKKSRLNLLYGYKNFTFQRIDISNLEDVKRGFNSFKPEIVVNLAAQAGVRYSLENPHAYIQSNVVGFTNIIESCRYYNVSGLIYASSSSVYGGMKKHLFQLVILINQSQYMLHQRKQMNSLPIHIAIYMV